MEKFNKPNVLSLTGNTAENWRRFMQQLNIYLIASGNDEARDKMKVSLLLNFAGEEAIEVFNTFTFEKEEDKWIFKTVESKFEEYCNPRKNVVFERFMYWKSIQEDETIDQYVTKLRKLIKNCEYPQQINDEMLRDKLVFGVKDVRMKERLLRESDLSLETALKMCRAAEQTKIHMQQMSNDESRTPEVHALDRRGTKSKQENKVDDKKSRISNCKFCGSSHKVKACPAFGKTCPYCKKVGHVEAVCWTKKKEVNTLQDQEDSEENPACLSIDKINAEPLEKDPWNVSLTINSQTLKMKIDTGANCNVISHDKLVSIGVSYQRCKKNNKLNVYGGDKVKVIGQVSLDCEYRKKIHLLTFNVISQDAPSILGLPGIEELGLVQRVYSASCDDELLQEFSDVFEGLGQIKGVEHTIRLKENAIPVVHPPRRVPAKLKNPLKEELTRMVNLGVIEKVDGPTKWVNSLVIVRKKNNKLRLCMDPSDLNKSIMREHFPMKSVEEVMSQMPDARVFSVLDANHGFWQIKLSEASSQLCTFNTPFGRYAFKRLPFGISSAPEVFQGIMTQLFEDIDGCEVIIDDLLIWGRNIEEHDARLRIVLERARKYNVKLNREKCQLRRDNVTYIGHQLTADGVKPDPKKVEAVHAMKTPLNKEELQRHLGMITYLSKFIPNMSAISAPLRQLLEKTVEWHWNEHHDAALAELKNAITSAPVLRYFNPKLPITLSVDASSKGLGAVILHEDHPIAFASRSLTSAEQNYAQIEREMLAITFGCERFHDYLYGQEEVIVETDHKPIEAIKKKPIHSATPRLQRMLLKIQPYAVNIKYKPGRELYIADALSRHFIEDTEGSCEEEFEVHLIEAGQVSQDVYKDLVKYTKEELLQLYQVVLQGWPQTVQELPESVRDYWNYRDEVGIQDGLLLKGTRLIIPPSMQDMILQRLHIGHSGREKTKDKARNYVFWPRINAAIDHMIERCAPCLKHSRQQQREPMIPLDVPDRPWQVVGMDHFYFYGQDYLVIIDYFSKYPEVIRVHQKTAGSAIRGAKEVFARHGIPERIIADNMPFNSTEFRKFCTSWGINVITSSPTYYRSHGLVERCVQIVKQMLRKSRESGDDSFQALLELRNAPLSGIGYSPAELLMSRRLRTMVPVLASTLAPQVVQKAREALLQRQVKQKTDYDRGTRALPHLEAGDTVRVRSGSTWEPAQVTGTCNTPRSYDVITANGQQLRRNRSHLLATKEPAPSIHHEITDDPVIPTDNGNDVQPAARSEAAKPASSSGSSSSQNAAAEGTLRTRYGRQVKPPVRFGYN